MKNLVVLFLGLILAISVNAQDLERSANVGRSYGSYSGRANDSITANQDTVYVTFEMDADQSFLWDVNVMLDTISAFGANDSVKIEPFGRVFKSDSWSSIGTAQYWDAVGDSPITFEEKSTADFVRYIQIRLTNIGTGKATLRRANSTETGRDIEVKGWY